MAAAAHRHQAVRRGAGRAVMRLGTLARRCGGFKGAFARRAQEQRPIAGA